MADQDENNRLRHGLNVQCLENIFQNLKSADLFTLGEMNVFYKQIIYDLVMPNHIVDFVNLDSRNIKITQMFEKYGKRIQKFESHDEGRENSMTYLLDSITKYCSNFQLKDVTMNCAIPFYYFDLPIKFNSVEKFTFRGCQEEDENQPILAGELSESLRYLSLSNLKLGDDFEWNNMVNLNELYLDSVNGINTEEFIEFLRKKPELKIFHHSAVFEKLTKNICTIMAEYCGKHIEAYGGHIPLEETPQNFYTFLPKLINLKNVSLETHQVCGGDLVGILRRLAVDNKIETLKLMYSSPASDKTGNVQCIFKDKKYIDSDNMNHFEHLTTLNIRGGFDVNFCHAKVCDPFELLNVYGSQILTNLNHLLISSVIKNWDFLKFAKNLQILELVGVSKMYCDPATIFEYLENIIRLRNNGQIVMQDFINLRFHDKNCFEAFSAVDGRCDAITLDMSCDCCSSWNRKMIETE